MHTGRVRGGSVEQTALRRAGKQSGGAESPAQVILGVGVAARKAWAAVTQHGRDQSRRGAGSEEFARDPAIRDAPVGRRVPLADAQPVQTGFVQVV